MKTILRTQTPPSVATDAGGDPHAKVKKERITGHNVFKHIPKDPNCDISRMTKDRARKVQKQTSDPRGWDLSAHLIWRHNNSGPHKLKMSTTSQEMMTGTLSSCEMDILFGCRVTLRKTQDAPFQKPGRVYTGRGPTTGSRDEDSSFFRNQQDRRRSCSTGEGRRTVRWNVITTSDGQTACAKICEIKFDGTFFPFEAKVSDKPTSS